MTMNTDNNQPFHEPSKADDYTLHCWELWNLDFETIPGTNLNEHEWAEAGKTVLLKFDY